MSVSAAAHAAGIRPGMRRGGALGLLPEVDMRERAEALEHERLLALAQALLRFSPQVTLAREATVLLDVSASLRLFGGIRALHGSIRETLGALALSGRIGMAPTGSGAWVLARHRRYALRAERLAQLVAGLPLNTLDEARAHQDWLSGLGCASLGDLLRLPRAGLKRRTGPALLDALDRILGRSAELFDWLDIPECFDAQQELPDRTEDTGMLLGCLEGLVAQLAGWLQVRQCAVRSVRISLHHERGRAALEPTVLDIALAAPSTSSFYLLRLIGERLSRLTLPAAVLSLRLQLLDHEAAEPPSDMLFPDPGGSPDDHRRLLGLLCARLGETRLRHPAPRADHRPEIANRWLPEAPCARLAIQACLPRPLWLLETPLPLLTRGHRPFYGTPLRIVSSAERIEAGWWSADSVARDYYIAESQDHGCYWVFRQRPGLGLEEEPRWFLHGLFA